MAIHIGERIRQRAAELRMGPTELGRMINTSKQNVYGIYKRKSIDTEILRKLSKALNCDFFQYYYHPDPHSSIAHESGYVYGRKNKNHVSVEEFQKLKKEFEDLREKYDLLKKINSLLENQKKK
ncbi:MAG TPA: helix-turn-helix transcriptional regulator [Bacteroidia bacterium]|nr:helix-turn-helix transcriptional regulator [Bacteroidia bacterium]